MTRARIPLLLASAGLLALTACTDPAVQTADPKQRTKEGLAVGAGIGALTGILLGDNAKERRRGAVIGAAVGAAAGSMIGAQMDKQAAQLRRDFGNDEITVVRQGDHLVVTMPQDILFATDSDYVNAGLQSDLRVLARSLNDYPNTTVDVIGHTDNVGEAAYNQQLSNRRARAVANVLYDSGVATNRIRAYGMGEDQPVASNLTPEGRARNRRVEIVIRPMT
ncbi:OmpA family protein [Actibacterium sp. MT2.3-13A]|uniref:OmpA family protein n=1 Tax=Actibacterium sp. MT2.3-13A TaxID=2828332 RepID=UPI001BA793D2|nr:OmpA family protein [Actibacterium sp. MT2.3-13A]